LENIGKVPFTRRHIEGNNKILDALFEVVKQKRFDMMRFANRIDGLSDNNDTRKLEGRKFLLQN
jgi:hypothetical protein